MNTFGIHSVNIDTFNIRPNDPTWYPKQARDIIITALRIHNLTLNVLGYMRFIPIVPFISGTIRMITGFVICAAVIGLGDKDASSGIIVGHYYPEAFFTGITQIARGALEAVIPFGWVANIALDTVGTFRNLRHEINNPYLCCPGCAGDVCQNSNMPHGDLDYPLPLLFLKLA